LFKVQSVAPSSLGVSRGSRFKVGGMGKCTVLSLSKYENMGIGKCGNWEILNVLNVLNGSGNQG